MGSFNYNIYFERWGDYIKLDEPPKPTKEQLKLQFLARVHELSSINSAKFDLEDDEEYHNQQLELLSFDPKLQAMWKDAMQHELEFDRKKIAIAEYCAEKVKDMEW